MGVAADQLLAAVIGDCRPVAGTALLEQKREEVDLKKHVAELVEHPGIVCLAGGAGELVGLLDRVADSRARVLLAIPRALGAQATGDLVKLAKRRGVSPRRLAGFGRL